MSHKRKSRGRAGSRIGLSEALASFFLSAPQSTVNPNMGFPCRPKMATNDD